MIFLPIIFVSILFLCIGGVVFSLTDGFGTIDSYDRGKSGARWKNYTVQDNAWQQFWYDRGFTRETYLRSDAVQNRKAEREKAKEDRVLARAKSKGWIDES
jgi:hypothetical protein